MRVKWKPTAMVTASDCGLYSMEIKQLPDKRWSYRITRYDGPVLEDLTADSEQEARAKAVACVRRFQKAPPRPVTRSPEREIAGMGLNE